MPVATLGSLQVRALVPRGDPVGVRAADRLRRACDEPLAAAVDESFQPLAELDAGAFWVVRTIRVHVAVPASEADPAALARRIADAIATAVERVVRAGPGADAVRFAGRAEYGASFVRALLSGAARSWVYERLGALSALRPVPALVAAAGSLDVDVLEVVGALAGTPGWPRMLAGATAPELDRLARAVQAAAGAAAAEPSLVESARTTRATTMVSPGRSSGAERRLVLLAHMVAAFGATPEVVAAVWAAEPAGADGRTLGPGRRVVPGGSWPDRRPRREAAAAAESEASAETGERARAGDGWAFAAAGAVAFMLLPDLDELVPAVGPASALAGADAAAAAVRAAVLGGVLGPAVAADDPALGLACGLDPAGAGEDEVAALLGRLGQWAGELRADPVLGWRHPGDDAWFDLSRLGHPALAALAPALLRRFAGHLVGFHRAGAGYLVERVLPAGGVVVGDELAIGVELPPPPLQVVLQIAGLDVFGIRPRWLDVSVTVTHEEYR